MVDPKSVGGGDHTVFVSGNDADAKAKVTELLESFGWTDVLDLGDCRRRAAPRCTWPCGSGSGAPPARASSTSRSSAEGRVAAARRAN